MSLLMLVAIPMNAQVNAIVDLYGKYKFTAEMTVTDAGKGLEENFSDNCDAVITKDNVYDAQITGIAGATGAHGVYDFDAETKQVIIRNWNGSNSSYWSGGLWMSNMDGLNPWANDLGDLILVFDDEKTISLPDFSLVSIADYSDSLGTIVATFKNAKLTLVEAEKVDIADLSGEWHFKAGEGNYDVMKESTLPSEFDMVITKTSDDNKNYTVDFTYHTYPTVKINATFDGVEFALALDSTLLDAENGVYIRRYYGNAHSKLPFSMVSERVLSLSTYAAIAMPHPNDTVTSDTILQYFIGSARKQEAESDRYDWSGTYKVVVKDSANVISADGGTYPMEFDMVVEYNEAYDAYYIVEFFGNDIKDINSGGISLKPSEDDSKNAEISTGGFIGTITYGKLYYQLFDGAGGNEPISIKVNEDGTITIGDFFVQKLAYDEDWNTTVTPAVFYQGVTATKEEADEPAQFTWDGTWAVTASVAMTGEGECPETFDMVVDYLEKWDMYLITNFMGNDVAVLNNGGILLTPADNAATIKTDVSVKSVVSGSHYYKMYDANGGNEALAVTVNEDGSLTIADFVLKNMFMDEDYKQTFADLASYTNVKAVKKEATSINAVEKETAKVTVNGGVINIEGGAQAVVVYDIAGRVEFSGVASSVENLAKGIHIVKVGNSVVKVNVK